MKIEVTRVVEHADGGATFTFTLDYEAILSMARIGIETAIMKAADGYLNPEGTGDAEAGASGDQDVHGEFPGF